MQSNLVASALRKSVRCSSKAVLNKYLKILGIIASAMQGEQSDTLADAE
jgi:hypothetical protein